MYSCSRIMLPKRVVFFLFLCNCCSFSRGIEIFEEVKKDEARRVIGQWAELLGTELWSFSSELTRRNEAADCFKHAVVLEEDAVTLLREMAALLNDTMNKKVAALNNIVWHARDLSRFRKKDIFENSTYDYYNANNLTSTAWNPDLALKLEADRIENEYHWGCDFLRYGNPNAISTNRQRNCYNISHIQHYPYYHRTLPLKYSNHYEEHVNANYSNINTYVINRRGLIHDVLVTYVSISKKQVLNDARWSEALDITFKSNFRQDSTLTWQYFASINGIMRLYPAIKWSDDDYNQTYEFRTRSWYLEAVSSPKDVMILLDRSGSMCREKRDVANQLINNILDTLGDNDYVNVYTFSKTVEPLVDCFVDTLVQANEENLRLIRESLEEYKNQFVANISIALEAAFKILERFRLTRDTGTDCNQIIMLITEAIDYEYDVELFKRYNWPDRYNRPVRIFTYLTRNETNDVKQMEWIACANMGYYTITSKIEMAREQVLKYLNVMSRPLNFANEKLDPIWSPIYVDLGDRRLTNSLWKKYQRLRQRRVYENLFRQELTRDNLVFLSDHHSMLQQHVLLIENELQGYERYTEKRKFTYLTTVSLPVYDRRPNATGVVGVAGVDVPIELLKQQLKPYRIGVNGYAFILTNNGFILLHPQLSTEFHNIPKPTFNRVDMAEVEFVDDSGGPRQFNQSLINLRNKIVMLQEGHETLPIKTPMDNMKRIVKSFRHYLYTPVKPFSLVLTYPDRYGFNSLKYPYEENQAARRVNFDSLRRAENWKIHPEWWYCKNNDSEINYESSEQELLHMLGQIMLKPDLLVHCDEMLVNLLLSDVQATEWFQEKLKIDRFEKSNHMNKFRAKLAFIATHSGLTRWQDLNEGYKSDDDYEEHFSKIHNKAIDEVWYKRAVEQNYDDSKYVYSVPFSSLGFDENTSVTSTYAIYRNDGSKRTPAAVIGVQFPHAVLHDYFKKITQMCDGRKCNITCSSRKLSCFVIDNNGYVVVSDQPEDKGFFIGDVRPNLLHFLVKDCVLESTKMYDYQAICNDKPREPLPKCSATKLRTIFQNLKTIFYWTLGNLLYFVRSVHSKLEDLRLVVQQKTKMFEEHQIAKTVPTPCDQEMCLYTVQPVPCTSPHVDNKNRLKDDCTWNYVYHHVPSSNLYLLVVNNLCPVGVYEKNCSATPRRVETYNVKLPCYVETKNKYARRSYIKCFNRHRKEEGLNERNKVHCGKEDEEEE